MSVRSFLDPGEVLLNITRKAARAAAATTRIFSLSAAIVALVCALAFRIAFGWIAMEIPLGLLIVFAGAIPLLNYFFEVIEHRATGERGWPVLSWETLVAFRRQLSFVLLFIVAATAFVQALFSAAGLASLGSLFAMCVMFVLPVSVAVLAVTRQLSKSVNPLFLANTIVRLEIGYVGILILSASWFFFAQQAWSAGSFVFLFAATISLLVLGFLIGSIVFACRRKLGLESARAPETLAARASAELRGAREHALGIAWGFASRDNVDGAVRHILEYAQEEEDALAAASSMFHRMSRWQYPSAALRLADDLVPRLEAAERTHEAAKIAVVCEAIRRAAQRTEPDE